MDGYLEYCVMKSPADTPVHGYLHDCAPDTVQTLVRSESNTHRLFSMKLLSVVSEFSYVVGTAETTADNVYEMGIDTQVVREGKIVAQSFAGKITPNR